MRRYSVSSSPLAPGADPNVVTATVGQVKFTTGTGRHMVSRCGLHRDWIACAVGWATDFCWALEPKPSRVALSNCVDDATCLQERTNKPNCSFPVPGFKTSKRPLFAAWSFHADQRSAHSHSDSQMAETASCSWPAPGSTTVWPQPCLVNYQLGAVSLAWCELCSPTSTCRMTNQLLFRSKELKLCPYLWESLCRSSKDRLRIGFQQYEGNILQYHYDPLWSTMALCGVLDLDHFPIPSDSFVHLKSIEIIWIYLDLGILGLVSGSNHHDRPRHWLGAHDGLLAGQAAKAVC